MRELADSGTAAARIVAAPTEADVPPLVAHVIHELGVGGLENGLVNLINHIPSGRYRHAIVCMTGHTAFRQRIHRADVQVYSMNRGQKSLLRVYVELFRLFRRLRPAIVHSRNLSGLDALVPALLAGVPLRIHGEHGRDIDDLDGSNRKYQRLKRMFRPFVTNYTTVSRDLATYLEERIGVPGGQISQIYNGVDTVLFHPRKAAMVESAQARALVVGTVGRLQPVKDQVSLVKAFAEACRLAPEPLAGARLVIVGEGPSRQLIETEVSASGIAPQSDLLGARDDISLLLRTFDIFVLPSLAEGISNTILEAMATGLPVVATRVGGNVELIEDGCTGTLVNSGDWKSMAQHIVSYARNEKLRERHGKAARSCVERDYSLAAMVGKYESLYGRLLERSASPR